MTEEKTLALRRDHPIARKRRARSILIRAAAIASVGCWLPWVLDSFFDWPRFTVVGIQSVFFLLGILFARRQFRLQQEIARVEQNFSDHQVEMATGQLSQPDRSLDAGALSNALGESGAVSTLEVER